MTVERSRKAFLVELQRRSTERDRAGQPREIWTTFRKEWASIEAVSGREYFNASAERATVTSKLRIPFGSGLAARDRVVYRGTVYDVKAVLLRGLDQELMCVEVA